MTDTERIVDKVRKLHAHAESARELGNEAEAQAFAAKVQELLTAYKLSQADLVGAGRTVAEPVNLTYVYWQDLGLEPRRVRVAWTETLLRLVADAYYCRFFVVGGQGGAIGAVIGQESDRAVAAFMFATIGRFLHRLAEQAYVRFFYDHVTRPGESLPPECRGFKAGFMAGFLERLRERFEAEVRPRADRPAAQTQAIVLVRRDTLARVDEWMRLNLRLHRARGVGSRVTDYGGHGRQAGRAAADQINLNRPLSGSAGGPRQLR